MGCHNNSCTGFIDFFKDFHNIPTGFRVKVTSRFVCNYHQGIVNNCPGNSHALLFAATKFARVRMSTITQANQFQHIHNSAFNLTIRCFNYLHSESYVFINSSIGKQSIILEDNSQLTTQVGNFFILQIKKVYTMNINITGSG